MEEIWKDIPGYENLYQVSSLGRVKSLERKVKYKNGAIHTINEKILKPHKNLGGYLQVQLCNEGIGKFMLVHRLVCDAFLVNQNNFTDINNIDENTTNNNVNNLEWCSHLYNTNFGTRNKRIAKSQTNNPKISKKVICIESGVIYQNAYEAQRKLGFKQTNICACCIGKRKTCGGLHWKYVD